jgi:hypothetical protein
MRCRAGRTAPARRRLASDASAPSRRRCSATRAASDLAQDRARTMSRCRRALVTGIVAPPGQPSSAASLHAATHRRTGLERASAAARRLSASAELLPRRIGLARALVRLGVSAERARCLLRMRSTAWAMRLRVPVGSVVCRRRLSRTGRPRAERGDARQGCARPRRRVVRPCGGGIVRGCLSRLVGSASGVALLRTSRSARSAVAAVEEGRAAHVAGQAGEEAPTDLCQHQMLSAWRSGGLTRRLVWRAP